MPARRTSLIALLIGVLLASSATGHAQKTPTVQSKFSADTFKVDGRLDEDAWKKAARNSNFVERKPRLGQAPAERTEFAVRFDGAALYVAVWCFDRQPRTIRAKTRQRDSFAIFRDDAISLKIDPGHDHRTTHGFALNPGGARLDYRGVNESSFLVEYDALWQGAARRTPLGWTAEFRIPFVALGIDPRTPPRRIGFNLSRDHSRRNATYDWALLAPPFSPVAASRYGHLEGLHRLPALLKGQALAGGSRFALVPYVLGGFRQARDAGSLETDGVFNAGLDARAVLGGGFRMQATINTDFAQVDLDEQVVNLDRFGLFLPEKRDFFLRDVETFNFGRSEHAQLLYTRRIGLFSGEEIPLLGGLKLVGRPSSRTKIGLLQTITRAEASRPWESQSVMRGRYEFGAGSHAGLMLTHRQSLEQTADDRNSAVGLDGAWRGKKRPILVEAYAMLTMTGARASDAASAVGQPKPSADKPAPGAGGTVFWRGRLIRPYVQYAYCHRDLRADLGFIKRVGVHDIVSGIEIEPRIERWGIEKIIAEVYGGAVIDLAGELLDWSAVASLSLRWDAGFNLSFIGQRLVETVQAPFSPAPNATINAETYRMNYLQAVLITPSVLPVNLELYLTLRDYYGGAMLIFRGVVEARPTRLFRFELGAEHSQARFSNDPASNFHTSIINGRVGFALTSDLQLDSYAAWNSLARLVRLQSRLRWRYRGGSDIFLVYQHDLDESAKKTLFQSLQLKVTFRWP